MKRSIACALMIAAGCVSLAQAAEVGPCNDLNRIENVKGQIKSFAKGAIRVVHSNTGGEPACCSSHLVILLQLNDGQYRCFAISDKVAGRRGYSFIELDQVRSDYDAEKGLLLTVPYFLYDDGKRTRPGKFSVRINQSNASVALEP